MILSVGWMVFEDYHRTYIRLYTHTPAPAWKQQRAYTCGNSYHLKIGKEMMLMIRIGHINIKIYVCICICDINILRVPWIQSDVPRDVPTIHDQDAYPISDSIELIHRFDYRSKSPHLWHSWLIPTLIIRHSHPSLLLLADCERFPTIINQRFLTVVNYPAGLSCWSWLPTNSINHRKSLLLQPSGWWFWPVPQICWSMK